MTSFLLALVIVSVVASFAALALVVGLEVREHLTARERPAAEPISVPRIPAQRESAAVIVPVLDAVAFDEFLAELIVTPHVEEALS